jgi:hypothetical protein
MGQNPTMDDWKSSGQSRRCRKQKGDSLESPFALIGVVGYAGGAGGAGGGVFFFRSCFGGKMSMRNLARRRVAGEPSPRSKPLSKWTGNVWGIILSVEKRREMFWRS